MVWTFLTNVVDKTPTTTGAWVQIDVSSDVPAGTKAVLLKIVNASSTSYNYGIRPVGTSSTIFYGTVTSTTGCAIAIVKLDSNYKFECRIENTSVKIYLWGYTDEDICMVNYVDKSISTTGAWTDVTCSELPDGSTGAVFEVINTSTAPTPFINLLRPKGSSTNHSSQGKLRPSSHKWAVVGVDNNKVCQNYIDNTASKIYLWGRAGNEFTSFLNPYDITPTTTGAWVTMDLSSYIPEGSSGILLYMHNTSTATVYKADARKYGSSDNHPSLTYGTQLLNGSYRPVVVGVSSDRKVDIYIANSAVKVYLWGYFFFPVLTKSISDSGVGVDVVGVTASTIIGDSGSGVDVVGVTSSAVIGDSGVGSEVILTGKTEIVSDSGVGVDSVFMTGSVSVSDSGSVVEVPSVTCSVAVADIGVGVDTVMPYGSIAIGDVGVGVDFATGGAFASFVDYGTGVEEVYLVSSVSVVDVGVGVDIVVSPVYTIVSDVGIGVEVVGVTVPVSDFGFGVELIGIISTVTVFDIGAGYEVIGVSVNLPVTDTGYGVEAIAISSMAMVYDYGVGVDALTISIPISDFGAGIDFPVISTTIQFFDTGIGAESIAVSSSISVVDVSSGVDFVDIIVGVVVGDFGAGVDFAELFLSIYGPVFIDGLLVGGHSIPYVDLCRDGLPIQTVRRSVMDSIFVDDVNVGDVEVEWEDKVTDITPDSRTLVVLSSVSIGD